MPNDKVEKIDFFKNQKNWIGFFIAEAMGQNNEVLKALSGQENPSIIEAKLILNGVECDVTKTLEYMGSVFDEQVESKAEKLVKERVEEMFFKKFEALDELVTELKGEVVERIDDMIKR